MDPELQSSLIRLTELTVTNAAPVVAGKISSFRTRKDTQAVITELIDLVNDLVGEKSELVSITQSLQSQLTSQQISDDDITYITDHVLPVIEGLAAGGEDNDVAGQLETLKPLLSSETLKVLQLLGFNYQQAIGVPLTELVASLIRSQDPSNRKVNTGRRKN